VDRHETDQDERPRGDQHLEPQADEVDPQPGRDQLEETVLDGGRLVRAGRRSGRHGFPLHTLTVVSRRRDTRRSYTTRVPNTPVRRLVRMPRQSVTANPRTGPVPNWNRIRPEQNVVTFESRIAYQARSKPLSIAARGVLPRRSSSRMRSRIRTFASTAMPMVSTMPAMPGSESVKPKAAKVPIRKSRFRSSAASATTPPRA